MRTSIDFLAQERYQAFQAGKTGALACGGILDKDAQRGCPFILRPP